MNKEYKQLMKRLSEDSERIFFIHYSCQNLSDDNEGYSPRITSIAVLHMTSDQMISFSMHLIAEELKIKRENINSEYDQIEELMLRRFFEFADANQNAIWIHWNMTNINFGFETLEHRFRVLSGKSPFHIEENKRYNLSELIKVRYGSNYVKDPKMQNLMDLNGGRHRSFLTGKEEVLAFKENEYIKLHSSTMCKVYFFRSTFNKLNMNTLRTDTNKFRYIVNELYQNPIVQILGIASFIVSVVSLLIMIT